MIQHLAQELPGMRIGHLRDLLRRALRHHVAAAIATFRSEVNDVVGGLNHFEVVFDDDNRIASVGQATEHREQLFMSSKCSPVVGSSRM